MTGRNAAPSALASLLRNGPSNWGRWAAPHDETGALNHLDPAQVLRAVGAVKQGRVFTLQMPMGDAGMELMHPSRRPAEHSMVQDRQSYVDGTAQPADGGLEWADDTITMHLQGTTHTDALGHAWYDDTIWNGQPAQSTNGQMRYASIRPLADRGIVGHGVLLDLARHRGKNTLDPGETFGHEDLIRCADNQGHSITHGDILVIRTGWAAWCRQHPEALNGLNEPGLVYSRELAHWFQDMNIPVLVTDTIANEATHHGSGVTFALHGALMRNLGIVFTELADLEDLAADCARDRQFTFLYAAAPLKITGATGSPTNPLAVK
ncbi:cyclase family protein [Streptomyces sp. NPDC004787]|uniref:cyclase family protein n=1 Tax=Streptomyces sp. NPDC004787 TaxID=3154291 RepID=UPI0033A302BD